MNESIKAIAGIFTGKGGTIRLAITGSIFGAIIYEILDSRYDFRAKSSSGSSISLSPASERSSESTITETQENSAESNITNPSSTKNQVPDNNK